MEQIASMYTGWIGGGGYAAVAAALAVNTLLMLDVSAPVLGFVGFLVFSGKMASAPAILAALAGELIGGGLLYGAGRLGGRFLARQGKRWPWPRRRLADLARRRAALAPRGLALVFLCRLLPGVRGPAPFGAGLLQLGYDGFLLVNGLSSVVWTVLFIDLGRQWGEAWRYTDAFSAQFAAGLLLALLVAVRGLRLAAGRRRTGRR